MHKFNYPIEVKKIRRRKKPKPIKVPEKKTQTYIYNDGTVVKAVRYI